jgi:hypothetical protein
MSQEPEINANVAARLEDHLRLRPNLSERIHRELLMELHRRGIAEIDAIHDQAKARIGQPAPEVVDDPNQAARDRWDDTLKAEVEAITRQYAVQHFSAADIDDLVHLALKREEVHSLENIATVPNVTFRELADKIQRFAELPLGETRLAPAEVVGTRVALIRHFISDQFELIDIAKNYLQIRHFADITRRMLGRDEGMGRIGGKAGGMTLAYHILQPHEAEGTEFPLAIPDSYYLRSDVIEDFIRLNKLGEYQNQKYKPVEDLVREYPLIRGVFRNGEFPLRIIQSLRGVLEKVGTHPLIVRSSSLLEDRFGTAFSGKYASFFLANQGTLEQRLRALLGAVAEVYASVLAPDPIVYRREHNLIHYVEEMAVLIQKVVGFRFGDYFLPAMAGVAFSRNEYRWSARIRKEDGLVRLVMGLGTRAVDRSGPDYPRMVALGVPTVRTESSVKEILRNSQQTLDVIDLKANRLQSIRFHDLLAHGTDFPMFDKIVSVYQDDELFPPTTTRVDVDPSRLYVTFDKLLQSTSFARVVRERLRRLEEAYGVPVDIEFACDGEKFYVLQCRVQSQSIESGPVTIPTDIPADRIIFDAHRFIRTGIVEGITHVVYVDPAAYDAVPNRERRVQVGQTIGRINHKLERRSFILIGPGRWGSNDLRLGVPVRYADINRCRMLIEVARQKDAFVPEVSFGTHFFQDLVEAGIDYLPLYPDEPGNRFNEAFFFNAPNLLAEVVPSEAEVADIVRVIHVPAIAQGRTLTVIMDGETDQAVAYLK